MICPNCGGKKIAKETRWEEARMKSGVLAGREAHVGHRRRAHMLSAVEERQMVAVKYGRCQACGFRWMMDPPQDL